MMDRTTSDEHSAGTQERAGLLDSGNFTGDITQGHKGSGPGVSGSSLGQAHMISDHGDNHQHHHHVHTHTHSRGQDNGSYDLPSRTHRSYRDAFAHAGNQVFFSSWYKVLYIVMIIINIFSLIWTIANGGYSREPWFIALEVFITVTLVLEVAARWLSQGKLYWRSKSNIFDFFVMSMCVLAICLFLSGPSFMEEAEDVLAITLNVFRYLVQFLRLGVLIKNQRNKAARPHEMIDFSTLTEGRDDGLGIPEASLDVDFAFNAAYSDDDEVI